MTLSHKFSFFTLLTRYHPNRGNRIKRWTTATKNGEGKPLLVMGALGNYFGCSIVVHATPRGLFKLLLLATMSSLPMVLGDICCGVCEPCVFCPDDCDPGMGNLCSDYTQPPENGCHCKNGCACGTECGGCLEGWQGSDCTVPPVNTSDCKYLVDLYKSTNGPSWFDNTNWDLNPLADCCDPNNKVRFSRLQTQCVCVCYKLTILGTPLQWHGIDCDVIGSESRVTKMWVIFVCVCKRIMYPPLPIPPSHTHTHTYTHMFHNPPRQPTFVQ